MAMVALAEQKVASKTPRTGISGLALEPVRSGHGVETLWLGPGQHVIGSASECSHVLRANGIQPRHCEIRIDAGRATLRALDFRTWLNNGPVRQVEIHVGDRLTVGPLEFRVTAHTQVEEAAASPVATMAAQPAAVSHTSPAVADHVTAVSERQREAENRLAETESRLLRQADEIQSRLRSLMVSEEGVAEKLARIHEQELALARRSATLDVQSTVARVAAASPLTSITPPTSIPAASVVPDFVVQATRRQAEEEARLAHARRSTRAAIRPSCSRGRVPWRPAKSNSPSGCRKSTSRSWPWCGAGALFDAQAATARVAPQAQTNVAPAVPDFVAQAARKQVEEATRLAQRKAQLAERADELQSRESAVTASEASVAQKLAQIHEQELAVARRSAVLDAQAEALATAPVTAQPGVVTSAAPSVAVPEFVAQAAERQAAEEARLGQWEARLEQSESRLGQRGRRTGSPRQVDQHDGRRAASTAGPVSRTRAGAHAGAAACSTVASWISNSGRPTSTRGSGNSKSG